MSEALAFDWQSIEEKWQRRWAEAKIFEANPKPGVKKFFITVAYPYPNSPQHIGHGRTYTLTDVYARFKRMRGYNVLFPMAFHYTGTPVLAIAKRVASGEKELLDDFLNIYKVPPEAIKTFTDPLKIADYFHSEIKEGMKEIGYSIDWRREFTTIDPPYSRFIEWQFGKLQSKGLITRGSHPVGWCPSCGSPLGQHDTRGDVEPEIGELTLVKFRFEDVYLLTGTLRPETVFGVTNIWIRPDVVYVKADVDGETWVVSKECAEKLMLLGRKVSLIGEVDGAGLVGRYVENPVTRGEVPILPASFVDPKNATGVVMSVPGHAPYDYVALEDLKRDEVALSKFGLKPEVVRGIKPVSLISVEGHSEFPAVDAVRRMGIKSQADPRVEEATKEVYNLEFHGGRMKENTGSFAGMDVAAARDAMEKELRETGKADVMYELLNRPVYCRCGGEAAVKIFKDQWFIDYGDAEWKSLAHKCLDGMRIVPEDLRVEFSNVIDWLKEKACARKQGLGTRLPWDPEWIIESLSDSVIYMSYYTIARYIRDCDVDARKLGSEVFDYVFLGVGDAEALGAETGLSPALLRDMRGEFSYFYPLDSRNSGRDLVPNHLTYFIFNHVAIFPEELWPRQIVVNGSVLMEGKKMSKSFGNIIPLRDALRTYGADPLRIGILATAELMQDLDFSDALTRSVRERLERFYSFALQTIDSSAEESAAEPSLIDRWILSRLQQRVKIVTEAMENVRFREAIQNALYMLDQDVQWYLRRAHGGGSPNVLKRVLEMRTLLFAPFAPHLCEEIWERLGRQPFISVSPWPSYDEAAMDAAVLEGEELVKTLRDDVANIVLVTKASPKRIFFYTASGWKWRVYLRALRLAAEGQVKVSELMREVMADSELRKNAKQVAAFVQNVVGDVGKTAADVARKRLELGVLDEVHIIEDAQDFYGKEFNAEIIMSRDDDAGRHDPKNRAVLAEPYRPAIYVE